MHRSHRSQQHLTADSSLVDHSGQYNHFSFHFRLLLLPSSVLKHNLYCRQMTNKLQSMFSFSAVLGHSVHHISITLVKWLASWGSQSTGWLPVLKAQTHSDIISLRSLLLFLKTLSVISSVCLSLSPCAPCLSSISSIMHIHTQIHTHIKIYVWTCPKA